MPTLDEWALKPSPRPAIFVAALIRRKIWLGDRLKTLVPGTMTASWGRMVSRASTAAEPKYKTAPCKRRR